jgi:hypothetical protein
MFNCSPFGQLSPLSLRVKQVKFQPRQVPSCRYKLKSRKSLASQGQRSSLGMSQPPIISRQPSTNRPDTAVSSSSATPIVRRLDSRESYHLRNVSVNFSSYDLSQRPTPLLVRPVVIQPQRPFTASLQGRSIQTPLQSHNDPLLPTTALIASTSVLYEPTQLRRISSSSPEPRSSLNVQRQEERPKSRVKSRPKTSTSNRGVAAYKSSRLKKMILVSRRLLSPYCSMMAKELETFSWLAQGNSGLGTAQTWL